MGTGTSDARASTYYLWIHNGNGEDPGQRAGVNVKARSGAASVGTSTDLPRTPLPKGSQMDRRSLSSGGPPPPLKPIHGSKTTGLAKMPRSLPGVTRYSTRAHTPHPLHSKLRCLSKYPARKAPPHELRRSERSVITGGSRATFYIILVSQVWGLNRLKADRRPQMHSHPRGLPLIVARKRTYKGHE